jgi:hypothetical protein
VLLFGWGNCEGVPQRIEVPLTELATAEKLQLERSPGPIRLFLLRLSYYVLSVTPLTPGGETTYFPSQVTRHRLTACDRDSSIKANKRRIYSEHGLPALTPRV